MATYDAPTAIANPRSRGRDGLVSGTIARPVVWEQRGHLGASGYQKWPAPQWNGDWVVAVYDPMPMHIRGKTVYRPRVGINLTFDADPNIGRPKTRGASSRLGTVGRGNASHTIHRGLFPRRGTVDRTDAERAVMTWGPFVSPIPQTLATYDAPSTIAQPKTRGLMLTPPHMGGIAPMTSVQIQTRGRTLTDPAHWMTISSMTFPVTMQVAAASVRVQRAISLPPAPEPATAFEMPVAGGVTVRALYGMVADMDVPTITDGVPHS